MECCEMTVPETMVMRFIGAPNQRSTHLPVRRQQDVILSEK